MPSLETQIEVRLPAIVENASLDESCCDGLAFEFCTTDTSRSIDDVSSEGNPGRCGDPFTARLQRVYGAPASTQECQAETE